jgi:hypothetical protein
LGADDAGRRGTEDAIRPSTEEEDGQGAEGETGRGDKEDAARPNTGGEEKADGAASEQPVGQVERGGSVSVPTEAGNVGATMTVAETLLVEPVAEPTVMMLEPAAPLVEPMVEPQLEGPREAALNAALGEASASGHVAVVSIGNLGAGSSEPPNEGAS